MKILGIISSANHNGKGAELTKTVCETAKGDGAEVEYIYLYDLDFKSCGNCQISEHDPGFCTKQDGLVDVLKKLIECDVFVWSAPIYMDYVCGTAQTFLDRFCIFVNPDFTINRIPGKKVVYIQTSGAPVEAYTDVQEKVCNNLSGFFKLDVVGKLAAGNMMAHDCELPVDLVTAAHEIGHKLMQQ
jgi:multimeric flavodoxin WrbA